MISLAYFRNHQNFDPVTVNKTEAVVLGFTNLVGADKIVSVYSPDYGQIRGVAHGIKRIKNRFGSSLEPLTHICLIFKSRPNRDLHLIQQADIINNYPELHRDIISLTAGLYVSELIQKLTPVGGDGEPGIFQTILKTLEVLTQKADIFPILRIFEVKFLDLLGYRPHLQKCLVCSDSHFKHGWAFCPSMGGLVCHLCRSKFIECRSISPGGIMFLKQALQMDLNMMGRLKIVTSGRKELEEILQSALSRHLVYPLKSYPVLVNLLTGKRHI